jgi:hypothetical protein
LRQRRTNKGASMRMSKEEASTTSHGRRSRRALSVLRWLGKQQHVLVYSPLTSMSISSPKGLAP